MIRSIVPVVPISVVRSRPSIIYMAYNPVTGFYGPYPLNGPYPRYYGGRRRYYGYYPGSTYTYHGTSSVSTSYCACHLKLC